MPVSSEITPKSCNEVVAANTLKLSETKAIAVPRSDISDSVIVAVKPGTVKWKGTSVCVDLLVIKVKTLAAV